MMKCWWCFDVFNYLDFYQTVAVWASSVAEAVKIIEDKMEYFPKKIVFINSSAIGDKDIKDIDIILG